MSKSTDARPAELAAAPGSATGERATCNGCGFNGHADEYKPCMSAYHDLRCPKCDTTDINTSEINEVWKFQGRTYGYGDDNSLKR